MIDIKKEDIIKELDMIQSCISRMSRNSFSMKGWHITIISALLLLFFKEYNIDYKHLSSIIIFITIMFWYLDAFYLLQERKYRWKYQWVLKNRLYSSELNNEYFMDMNVNNSNTWVSVSNSLSYKLAVFSSKRKHKLSKIFLKIFEVFSAMFSNVLQMEYILIIVLIVGIA